MIYGSKSVQRSLANALANEDIPLEDSVTQYTMDGTSQGAAVVDGANALHVYNAGATTEAVLVAFGTTQVIADTALTLTSDGAPEHATTGYAYVPAFADVGEIQKIPIPEGALFYALANAVDSDVNLVVVSQKY